MTWMGYRAPARRDVSTRSRQSTGGSPRWSRAGLLGVPLAALVAIGCGGGSGEDDASVAADAGPPDAGPTGPVQPIFDPAVLEGGGAFFDFPYPSDLRTDDEGHPDLSGFPRARGLVGDVIAAVESERAGFSPITGVYFRFTGPLDPASLPADPEAARGEASRALLIDVDEASPDRGRRMPAYVRFQRDATTFWPANTLVVRAVPGAHLHPARRYAAVVLSGVRAADGSAVEPSPDFAGVSGASGLLGEHYAALLDELEAHGVARADVLVASAFTTSDPAVEMDVAREYIASVPLPEVRSWRVLANRPTMLQLEAEVDVYELMEGEPPYMTFGSGRIAFDASGAPLSVTRRAVKLGLSVPVGDPVPAGGVPVVLYGHGTGGDHTTHLGDEGAELAGIGIAMVGFEAALHGGRNPGGFDVETLILSNAVAARETIRQTVIDQMLFYRLLAAGALDVPADVAGGTAIPLAREPILYMGHSQGSQEAGVLLGVEPTVQAAFLSAGGGGAIISVIERELGTSTVACTLAPLIGETCENLGEDHPLLLLLVQPLMDPADPLSFAHRFVRERPSDWAPLSIAMTEGTADMYTPPRTIEALAAAIGLPLVEPVVQTSDPLRLSGDLRVAPPVSANLTLPGGELVTGGLMQFEGADHFAIYRVDDAKRRYVEFFRTAVAGTPTLVGPAP